MPRSGNRGRLAALATGGAVVGLAASALTGLPSQAAGAHLAAAYHATGSPVATPASGRESTSRKPGYYDARQLAPKQASRAAAENLQSRSAADRSYTQSLGTQSLVDIDALTGTPREFGELDGFLTGRSSRPARTVALDYVRQHLSVLGLSSSDLSTLRFHGDYVDSLGLHNLSWTQSVDGTPVYGNGLKVKVTRDGRVLDVQGSPVHGLAKLAADAPDSTRVDAAEARSAAARDVGGHAAEAPVASSRSGSAASTRWANDDYSTKVWFLTPSGLRPGWSTYVTSGAGSYEHVIDAVTGNVLLRRSTTDDDSASLSDPAAVSTVLPAKHSAGPSKAEKSTKKNEHHKGDAKVFPNYPGAKVGGTQVVVNLIDKGWLKASAKYLRGTSVTAFADVNDDNAINANEKTPVPGTKHAAQFTFKPQHSGASKLCSKTLQCSWKPNKPFSWRANRNADVTNAFYLANRFHDWLESGPAKFTVKAGNFSASDGDPVLLNALDGASVDHGLPDGNHIDNANMSTPPDGTPPTMQMYLWHQPGLTDDEDPFLPSSGALDPSILWHEYTHGLSNRLVVDADGVSTLNDLQAGSMGEAWSDYYALDYLVRLGLVDDSKKSGDVLEGDYIAAHKPLIRTMAIDCPVHTKAKGCKAEDGTKGGYTYGQVSSIIGVPEVHASGEIWGQTLWDIRDAFGSTKADTLITRAMSLSADDPSMLDMRNAILQADLVGFNAEDTHRLWKIFAERGMGYFAGSAGSADALPAQNFKTPPKPSTPRSSLTGHVTDPTTGDAVGGAVVTVTGFGTRFQAVTNAAGTYTIDDLYRGTYPKVTVSAPGYVGSVKSVTLPLKASADFSVERDWAAQSGGGSIADFNGPDFSSFACGPSGAIDLGLGTGWGSTTGDDAGDPTNVFVPKFIVVKLPKSIDITSFGVDPNATCGDPGSSSTGQYEIETSPDGNTYQQVATGTFTADDRGRLNRVDATTGTQGVQYVRFTILGNQTPDFATNCPKGAFGGCAFTDLSEFAVFGAETPATN